MKLTIGKKLQSKTTGKIAVIASAVVDGFITMKFEDGSEKHFAEYVIQERWQEKIDKNFKGKVEENKVIQSTQEARRSKVSSGKQKTKAGVRVPLCNVYLGEIRQKKRRNKSLGNFAAERKRGAEDLFQSE